MKKLFCFLFGHKYRLVKKITKSIYELDCKRCGCEFGMNTSVQALLPLDAELKSLHEELKPKPNNQI